MPAISHLVNPLVEQPDNWMSLTQTAKYYISHFSAINYVSHNKDSNIHWVPLSTLTHYNPNNLFKFHLKKSFGKL